MEKEFIPYKQALALKELGFDEECLAIYYKDDEPKKLLFSIEERYSSNPEVAKHQARNAIRDINFEKGWAIKVPLYQQAFKWLYQKLDIEKGIMPLDIEPQQLLLKELIDKVIKVDPTCIL